MLASMSSGPVDKSLVSPKSTADDKPTILPKSTGVDKPTISESTTKVDNSRISPKLAQVDKLGASKDSNQVDKPSISKAAPGAVVDKDMSTVGKSTDSKVPGHQVYAVDNGGISTNDKDKVTNNVSTGSNPPLSMTNPKVNDTGPLVSLPALPPPLPRRDMSRPPPLPPSIPMPPPLPLAVPTADLRLSPGPQQYKRYTTLLDDMKASGGNNREAYQDVMKSIKSSDMDVGVKMSCC